MSNPWSYSPENSNVKLCIWVLGIGGCTVKLVNSLFVFLVNIAHCLFYCMNEGQKKL